MPNLSTLNYGKTCLAEGVQHKQYLIFIILQIIKLKKQLQKLWQRYLR